MNKLLSPTEFSLNRATDYYVYKPEIPTITGRPTHQQTVEYWLHSDKDKPDNRDVYSAHGRRQICYGF